MKNLSKYLLIFSFLVSNLQAGGFTNCPDLISHDIPQSNSKETVQLCREAYLVNYDVKHKVPVYVAYDLSPNHAVGCILRSDKFKADTDTTSAKSSDFNKSGYDKGHMAPGADFQWDKQVELQSFYMSNMAPQLPNLNRYSWQQLEVTIRAWAMTRKETLTIYTGTIYNDGDKKLKNEVTIPNAFFKIIVFNKSKFALAFIYPQSDIKNLNIHDFQTTIEDVEQKTNLKFNLGYDKKAKSAIPDVEVGIVNSTEKKVCKR